MFGFAGLSSIHPMWSCLLSPVFLLQYFQSSDPTPGNGAHWRSCPVCAELIHLKQLRPIHFCPATEPREGDIFHSILLSKPVKSQFPLSTSHPHNNLTISDLSPFHRLIPINNTFLLNEIILPEILSIKEEIKGKRARGEESLEISYLEAALKFMEDKRFIINSSHKDNNNNNNSESNNNNHMIGNSVSVSSADGIRKTKCHTGGNNYSSSSDSSSDYSELRMFYFHQSRDGLNVFLHPLCMKLLLSEYLEYSLIPSELSLPILQCDRLIVNETNRRRFKYLDHLPLGAQIILVEVDLEGVVSCETLLQHSREVKSRDSARQVKRQHDAARHHRDTSILEEWKRMEDDIYDAATSDAIPINAPEAVNLDDLYDETFFPLPSSLTSPPVHMAAGRRPFSTPTATAASSFADIASSPPSFSDLANSFNSPYFIPNQAHTQAQTQAQTYNYSSTSLLSGGSAASLSLSMSSDETTTTPTSPSSPPTTTTATASKKKYVLFTNDMMNRRK